MNLLMSIMNFEAWQHFVSFTEDRGAGLSLYWHIYNVMASVVPGMPELGSQHRVSPDVPERRRPQKLNAGVISGPSGPR